MSLWMLVSWGCGAVLLAPRSGGEVGLRDDEAVCPRLACNRFDVDEDGVASTRDLVAVLADGCDAAEAAGCFPDIDGDGASGTSDIVAFFTAGLDTSVDTTCGELPACPLTFDSQDALLEGRIRSLIEAAEQAGVPLDDDEVWRSAAGETLTGRVPLDAPVLHPNGVIEGPDDLPERLDAWITDHGDTDPLWMAAREVEGLATFGLLNPADPLQRDAIEDWELLFGTATVDLTRPAPEPAHACRASCNLYLRQTLKEVTAETATTCTGRTDAVLMHEALDWCYDEFYDDWVEGVSLVHQECVAQADVTAMCFVREGIPGDCDQETCLLQGHSAAAAHLATEAARRTDALFDWGGRTSALSEAFGRMAVLDWGGEGPGDVEGGHVTVRAISDVQVGHCGASENPFANCVLTGGLSAEGPSVGVECPVSDLAGAFGGQDEARDRCNDPAYANDPFCETTVDLTICNGDLTAAYQAITFEYDSDSTGQASDPQTMSIALRSDGYATQYVHLLDVRAENLLYTTGARDVPGWVDAIDTTDWVGHGSDAYAGTGWVESRDVLTDVRSLDTLSRRADPQTKEHWPLSCDVAHGFVPEGSSYEVAVTVEEIPEVGGRALGLVEVLPAFDTVVEVGCYGEFADRVIEGTCEQVVDEWDPLTADSASCTVL